MPCSHLLIVISVFNNNSCLNDDGTDNIKLMEEPEPSGIYEAPFDSQAYIFAIDLEAGTAELLDAFSVTGERTEYAGSVFDIGDYFNIYYGDTTKYFIFDAAGTIGVECQMTDPNASYRGRIFKYDEIRSLI